MKTVGILAYSPHSKGAKQMARMLGASLLPRDYFGRWGSSVKKGGMTSDQAGNIIKDPIDVVINWGVGGSLGTHPGVVVINKNTFVARVVDKLNFFRLMEKAKNGPRVPPFTTEPTEAIKWVKEGKTVMARQTTEGKGGHGILFYDDDNLSEFINAPLFVEYILNMHEYRAHCAFGKIIYWQKKALLYDADRSKVDMRVRCHRNGFFFMSEGNFDIPMDVMEQAEKAMKSTPLEFVAFDIIYNKHYDKAYVLEGNTAMGIDEGETAQKYAEAFLANIP